MTDGRFTDVQPFRKLLVVQTLGHERRDLAFTAAQRSDLDLVGVGGLRFCAPRELSQEAGGHQSIQPGFAGVDALNRLQQRVGRLVLQDHP